MDRRTILKGAVDGLILAVAGNEVFAAENSIKQPITQDNSNSQNTAHTAFVPSGAGAVATSVQRKLSESISVLDFGASPTASAEANVAAFQAALNHAKGLRGATIHVPAGSYQLNAAINVYANTTLYGDGWHVSGLYFNHTGNGVNSTWPINSSTTANINIKDLSIANHHGSNTGGGLWMLGELM